MHHLLYIEIIFVVVVLYIFIFFLHNFNFLLFSIQMIIFEAVLWRHHSSFVVSTVTSQTSPEPYRAEIIS